MNEVRMKKRILSAVLAFLMTVSLVPVSAFASTATHADAFTICVTGGAAIVVYLVSPTRMPSWTAHRWIIPSRWMARKVPGTP